MESGKAGWLKDRSGSNPGVQSAAGHGNSIDWECTAGRFESDWGSPGLSAADAGIFSETGGDCGARFQKPYHDHQLYASFKPCSWGPADADRGTHYQRTCKSTSGCDGSISADRSGEEGWTGAHECSRGRKSSQTSGKRKEGKEKNTSGWGCGAGISGYGKPHENGYGNQGQHQPKG